MRQYNKNEAIQRIDLLANKAIGLKTPRGETAFMAIQFRYQDALAWDGVSVAPKSLVGYAVNKDISVTEAQSITITKYEQLKDHVADVYLLRSNALVDLRVLSNNTPAPAVMAVYLLHLGLFEDIMEFA
jgi:hypothetical protein